jgi:transposase-like protein
MRSIFYASSREKALEFFAQQMDKWQREFPSALKCLESSIDACLTFFHYPEEHWISLRIPTLLNGSIRSLDAEQNPWRSSPGSMPATLSWRLSA